MSLITLINNQSLLTALYGALNCTLGTMQRPSNGISHWILPTILWIRFDLSLYLINRDREVSHLNPANLYWSRNLNPNYLHSVCWITYCIHACHRCIGKVVLTLDGYSTVVNEIYARKSKEFFFFVLCSPVNISRLWMISAHDTLMPGRLKEFRFPERYLWSTTGSLETASVILTLNKCFKEQKSQRFGIQCRKAKHRDMEMSRVWMFKGN